VGPRVVLDAVVKRRIPSPRRQSNPRTPNLCNLSVCFWLFRLSLPWRCSASGVHFFTSSWQNSFMWFQRQNFVKDRSRHLLYAFILCTSYKEHMKFIDASRKLTNYGEVGHYNGPMQRTSAKHCYVFWALWGIFHELFNYPFCPELFHYPSLGLMSRFSFPQCKSGSRHLTVLCYGCS